MRDASGDTSGYQPAVLRFTFDLLQNGTLYSSSYAVPRYTRFKSEILHLICRLHFVLKTQTAYGT